MPFVRWAAFRFCVACGDRRLVAVSRATGLATASGISRREVKEGNADGEKWEVITSAVSAAAGGEWPEGGPGKSDAIGCPETTTLDGPLC